MENENEVMQDIADISCEYGLEHVDEDDTVKGFIWEFSEQRKMIKELEVSAKKYKDLHDMAKGRVNKANEYIDKLQQRIRGLEDIVEPLKDGIVNVKHIAEGNIARCGTCSAISDFIFLHHRDVEGVKDEL